MPETQPEPLAAILADYRADIPAMTSGELPHPTPEYLRIMLDRIEAAAKREYEEAENYFAKLHDGPSMICTAKNCAMRNVGLAIANAAPGNAAVMRAALERALKWWTEKGNILEREAAFKQIRAALAAPARNCDRFATAVGAMEEWEKYPQSRYKGCRVCPHGDTSMVSPSHLTLAEWLFAPAKGGAE